MASNNQATPVWSSRFSFYLSAVGAAVGLGSIWRFPYLAGTGGGGAFIFVFVLVCLAIATPFLAAEFLLGRRARRSPLQAAGVVAQASGLSARWNVIGVLGTLATFMAMSYYTVIAGWVHAYTWKVGSGALVGLARPEVAGLWRGFLSSPWEVGAWHLAFIVLAAFILWSDWRPLGVIPVFAKSTFFDVMDYVASNVLLPIGALLASLFVGWRISRSIVAEQLEETTPLARRLLVWLLRYLCPLAIAVILATVVV